MHAHLERLDLDPARLARWRLAADALGEHGHALRLELADVAIDPSRHMLRRAARAARLAEQHTTGEAAMIANVVGGEIEDHAEAGRG